MARLKIATLALGACCVLSSTAICGQFVVAAGVDPARIDVNSDGWTSRRDQAGGIAGTCGPQCDSCWLGTPFEDDCFLEWEDDGLCDCGCQFPDTSDCGSSPCDPSCDFCWIGTVYENDCELSWEGDGDCDCGCQFPDSVDCGSPQCGPECDWCWFGTSNENNCDPSWQVDGECDCGCQFDDAFDCAGGGVMPDLTIHASSVDPTAADVPGYAFNLHVAAANYGTGDTPADYDVTWYISIDSTVDLLDLPWAYGTVTCCLQPGLRLILDGPARWPDAAPYNSPEQTYYVAVMADDVNAIPELDENNNWGQVIPVTLCDHPGDASGNAIVNLEDYRRIRGCMRGPGMPDPVGCLCTDQDGDDDVDLADFAAFQNVLEVR